VSRISSTRARITDNARNPIQTDARAFEVTISSPDLSKMRWKKVLQLALVISVTTFPIAAATPAGDAGLRLTTLTTPGARAVPSLTAVIVSGSSVYSAPELFASYRAQLGQPISRDNAQAITAALAARYSADGYLQPELVLDDSLTGNGVLRVQVFEPLVTRVVFEGDSGSFRDALERIGDNLENRKPLRTGDVPQALQRMREIAGLAVSASTRRDSSTRNAFELVVKSDFSTIDGVVRMNNRGTREAGPNFLLGQVFANGLLGLQEKIGLIFAAATDHDEYLGGGLFIDTPLGASGTHANLLVFRSHSAPNERPVNLDDEYVRQRTSIRVSHPLRKDSGVSLTASAAFDLDDLSVDAAGATVREDKLRIVETALRAGWRAGAVQYSTNLQIRKGLNGFGSGLVALDLADDPRQADFLVTLLQASAYRRLGERWSMRFDAFAQTSQDVLPDGERFKIGGDRLGRGFEVPEIAGDNGLGGKIELRRDLANTESMFGRVSTYGFYDIGAAWKQDRPGRESAATAGVGLAIGGGTLTGYLELASPLTGPDIEGKRSASVFAELSYRF
jgi:hemolysin activation/secretion protein